MICRRSRHGSFSGLVSERGQSCRDWQAQRHLPALAPRKSQPLVKPACQKILCVNNQRKNRRTRHCRLARRIHHQRRPQPAPPKRLVHRQPIDQPRRTHPISGQFFHQLCRQIEQRHTARRERIISSDHAALIARHKTIAQPPFHILRRPLDQIPIQRLYARTKRFSPFARSQNLNRERSRQASSAINRR